MTTSNPLVDARQADSAARRRRVLKALDQLAASGGELSVSAVARSARVNRSFIYRHADLHAAVTERASRVAEDTSGSAISKASLMAELANATGRARRQAQQIARLEKRLSEVLGQSVWQESGLGSPLDVEVLNHRITELEQTAVELRSQLSDREDELDAARAANRELMTRLNTPAAR